MLKSFHNQSKRNWFPTLNQSLESENLVEFWKMGLNINYGETVRHYAETDQGTRVIIIYRNEEGNYERPVHYLT